MNPISPTLKRETIAKRALLLVHQNTPGAVGFFKRLGFKIIDDAYSKNIFSAFYADSNKNYLLKNI